MELTSRMPNQTWLKVAVLMAAVMGSGIVLPARAGASETRLARPNLIGIEVFGRNIKYSVFYDRSLGPDWVVGVGFGKTGLRDLSGTDQGQTATWLPLYANYYLERKASALFLTAAATFLISDSVADQKTDSPTFVFPDNPLVPNFGFGYESRTDAGFSIRVTGYMLVGKNILPWVGGSIGFAF